MTGRDLVLEARALDAEDDRDLPELGAPLRLAALAILFLLVAMVGWAAWARLDSAVIAQGTVIADSRRKTVQHLEGGILQTLLVQEGDRVAAGQPVAQLDATQPQAQVAQIEDQLLVARARLARLEAEARGDPVIGFAEDLANNPNASVQAVLATQRSLFEARAQTLAGRIAVLERQIAQLGSESEGARRQLQSIDKQLGLFAQERDAVASLLAKGHERRPRLLELERNIAMLQGQKSQLEQIVASREQAIAQARLEIANVQSERRAEIGDELDRTRAIAADLGSRLEAARDVLDRRVVRAPQEGVVANIRLVTPGGVIGPGQPLLDIVPADDELVIETRLPIDTVDNVQVGQSAQVRLTAFRRSQVPLVDGEVSYLAADATEDQRSGERYFVARVKLAQGALDHLAGVSLSAGMPAEVMIDTGERRAIDYFLDPIAETTRHAFRED